jgi:glyoxylase I family protein
MDLKSFILEYGSSKTSRIQDPNGLILNFAVDHKDGREIERELASTAREDLQQLVCGDRKPSNRCRSAVSAAKNIG